MIKDIISKIEALGYTFSYENEGNHHVYGFTKEREDNNLVTVVELYQDSYGEWNFYLEIEDSRGMDIDWNGASLSKEDLLIFAELMKEVSK